ncbi:MAG: hypothetical protein DRO88_02155 [Promethearchaeia archaeon]|nr:MAG: hypothetical protein DRO88_02155 [Candidatus Lokiarchaeia archaeon]
MDFNTALEKLSNIYRKVDQAQNIKPGFGDFYLKYPAKVGYGFLYILMSPPQRRYKGKKKDLDKLLNKSAKSNRVILPKDFDEIVYYLYQNFSNLVKSRNQILNKLEEIIAGLRLELHFFHNLKFAVKDPSKIDMIVFENSSKREFWAYVNLVGFEETGLALAHERQIEFIRENLKKGIDPRDLHSLPPLRTGETKVDFSKQKANQTGKRPKESELVQKFREKLKQKKVQGEVEEELAFETVIDFSKQDRVSITPNPTVNSSSRSESNQFEIKEKEEASIDETKIVKESGYQRIGTKSENPVLNEPIVNIKPYIDIPKPSPLSSDSIINSSDPDLKQNSSPLTIEEPSHKPNSLPPPLSLEEGVKLSTGFTPKEFHELQEENKILKIQLEQVTDALTKKIEQKDKEIQSLNEKLNQLSDQKQVLLEKYESIQQNYKKLQSDTTEKMRNFREKVQKIQDRIQPLIKENQQLKAKWEHEIHQQKVGDNIELINQNLTLQEKVEQLTNQNAQLIEILKKIQQSHSSSSESFNNKETASELKAALLYSLQEKHKQLKKQQDQQEKGK